MTYCQSSTDEKTIAAPSGSTFILLKDYITAVFGITNDEGFENGSAALHAY